MTDEAKAKGGYKFYVVNKQLVREDKDGFRDVFIKRGWAWDYDIEAFEQSATQINEEAARKRIGGADLYGASSDKGDNADDDRQKSFGYLDDPEGGTDGKDETSKGEAAP